MFKRKISFIVFLAAVAGLLMVACSAEEKAQMKPNKIDAHTLLIELEEMVREIPVTEKGCQAKLKEIRAWQKKSWKQLQAQSISPKFGFECQWVAQTNEPNTRACTKVQVLQLKNKTLQGDCSLEMTMDLDGGDEHKRNGEAWVNMLQNPPVGEHIPVNLLGRTVTAWIYAPWGARGEPDKPNGFQVFVKDKKWKGQYGPWRNVIPAEWFKISLKVSPFAPRDGYVDPNFDPTQIIAVGVKMGTGGGSKERYKGPVYIDGVNWE